MTVHFIGAGPGAPDLITVRGQNLVARCPVCLFAGSLVPREIVALCPPGARVIDTAPLDLDAITAEFVAAHDAGLEVARLHSGDLSVWSAMGEQIRRLENHGIPYTVTPGVPSFAAAAAALGRELTLPGVAQTVVLTRTSGRASAMPPGESRRLCRDRRNARDPSIGPCDRRGNRYIDSVLRSRRRCRRGGARELAGAGRHSRHAVDDRRQSARRANRTHGADPGRASTRRARFRRQRAVRPEL
jgi:precorrin-6B methylase 1